MPRASANFLAYVHEKRTRNEKSPEPGEDQRNGPGAEVHMRLHRHQGWVSIFLYVFSLFSGGVENCWWVVAQLTGGKVRFYSDLFSLVGFDMWCEHCAKTCVCTCVLN